MKYIKMMYNTALCVLKLEVNILKTDFSYYLNLLHTLIRTIFCDAEFRFEIPLLALSPPTYMYVMKVTGPVSILGAFCEHEARRAVFIQQNYFTYSYSDLESVVLLCSS